MCGKSSTRAFTLLEMMIALCVASLVGLAIMSFCLFTSRSFASLSNYTILDEESQVALDKMSQQIRQVNKLTGYTTNSTGVITGLTFQDYDGSPLSFSYDSGARTLTRTKGAARELYLVACKSLQFQIFQRNVQAGTFDAITTGVATNCKLVQVSWTCSKKVGGTGLSNTETMQSTKIVLRQAP